MVGGVSAAHRCNVSGADNRAKVGPERGLRVSHLGVWYRYGYYECYNHVVHDLEVQGGGVSASGARGGGSD